MKRRQFIQSGIAGTSGLLWSASEQAGAEPAKSDKARIHRYQTLGKTDIKMSDISYGAGKLPSASMVLRAIDRGINYFDTAPDYGSSEKYIGQALKKLPSKREQIYIASKFCRNGSYVRGESHLQLGSSKQDYKNSVEDSLKRLNSDYLDVVFVHAIGESRHYEQEKQRLLDDNMLSAFAELKQEGKARYLAVSSHGPHHMEKLLMEAVNSGHFDLIMPAFNFFKFPKVPEVIQTAHNKGVGVIAMKTLAGARDMDFDAKGAVFEQAAFKWVLQHPQVGGLVVTIKRVHDLDLYLPASGTAMQAADRQVLNQYIARYGQDYCRTGCGDCETQCPEGVPVATILRYQMYFENYADEKNAMQSYARLNHSGDCCLNCSAPCQQGCPYGLPVAAKLQAAHQQLSFV